MSATKNISDLSSAEFEEACKKAVAERNEEPVADCVTRIDAATGKIRSVQFGLGKDLITEPADFDRWDAEIAEAFNHSDFEPDSATKVAFSRIEKAFSGEAKKAGFDSEDAMQDYMKDIRSEVRKD